jgi:signal transduction histidine kinase/PAS domain-containing protein
LEEATCWYSEKNRAMYEKLPVPFCVFKVDNSKMNLLVASDEVCRMVGKTRAEFMGSYVQSFSKRILPIDRDYIQSVKRKAIQHPGSSYSLKYCIQKDTGDAMTVLCSGKTERDEDGSLLFYSWYAHSPEKECCQIFSQLQNENTRLSRIINNVPAGIAACIIKEGRFQKVIINEYLSQLFNTPASVAENMSCESFLNYIHPTERKSVEKKFKSFLADEGGFNEIYRLYLNTTDYFWAHIDGNLIHRPDGTDVAYLVYTNVSTMKKIEAELNKRQYVYETAVKAAELLLWEYDIRNSRIVMSDSEACAKEWKAHNWRKVFDDVPSSITKYVIKDDIKKINELYQQVNLGRDSACDIWYKENENDEESLRCEHIIYTVERDDNGLPVKAYGIAQNITEQKNTELQYITELQNMRQKHEGNLIAKSQSNLSQNVVVNFYSETKASAELYVGMTFDEAVNAVSSLALTEEDAQKCRVFFNRKKLINDCLNGKTHGKFIYQRSSINNKSAWISFDVNTLCLPNTNDVEVFIYTYDVTEQMQLEAIMNLLSKMKFDFIGLLHEKTGMFELVKKSADVNLMDVHKLENYTTVINNMEATFLDGDADIDTVLSELHKHNQYTTSYLLNKNGTMFCKQIDYFWLDKHNNEILMVRTDITATYEHDQRQLESLESAKRNAERANEEKSLFLSSMSHDMRTPLNGILGFTDIAQRENEFGRVKTCLSKIESSGKLLLALVNDTLDLSRIENGKTELVQEPLSIRGLVESVTEAVRPSAELKHISLNFNTQLSNEVQVLGDVLKLQKIVLNLLSNAVKYTHEYGRVNLLLESVESKKEVPLYRIVVEDNGIGMSKEFQKKAFEPFAQEHQPGTENITGTGLGLAIVSQMVGVLHGTISLESDVGKGTRFIVELPLPFAEITNAAHVDDHLCQQNLFGKHVLLCEDNALNTEIAVTMLKEEGVIVDTASNGRDGVARFTASLEGTYDAVLMDLRMPIMNGYEATRLIRGLSRSDAKKVPIIAMSADAFEEDIKRTKECGMNNFVTKPIERQKLIDTLGKSI